MIADEEERSTKLNKSERNPEKGEISLIAVTQNSLKRYFSLLLYQSLCLSFWLPGTSSSLFNEVTLKR